MFSISYDKFYMYFEVSEIHILPLGSLNPIKSSQLMSVNCESNSLLPVISLYLGIWSNSW